MKVSYLEDHGHRLLVAHKLGKVLGATPPREETKHDLGQTKLRLGASDGGSGVVMV